MSSRRVRSPSSSSVSGSSEKNDRPVRQVAKVDYTPEKRPYNKVSAAVGGRKKGTKNKKSKTAKRRKISETLKEFYGTEEGAQTQEQRVKSLQNNLRRNTARNKLRRRSHLREPARLIDDPSFVTPDRAVPLAKLTQDMFLRLSLEQRRKLKEKKASRPGERIDIIISSLFSPDDLQMLHQHVMDNSHCVKVPNMTAGQFADHVHLQTGVSLSKAEARQLLREMGFVWEKLEPGYYANMQLKDYTIFHRTQLVPLLHWLHLHPEHFTIFYQDESPFRKNIYQNKAWINRDIPEHKFSMGRRTGKGDGWNVCSYLSGEHGILYDDADNASHIGYVIDSTEKGASATGKETAADFLVHLENAFKAMKQKYPGTIPVVVIDGARTHLTFPADRFDAKTANMEKATEKLPKTLKDWMVEHGIWNDGKSYTKRTAKGKPAKMTKEEAVALVEAHEEYVAQLMACEVIAKKYGGLIVVLPAAHPMLNPIELLWRNMKNQIRRLNGPTKEELGAIIDDVLVDESWYESALKGMFKQCESYRHWFMSNDARSDAISNPKMAPSANELRRMQKKNKLSRANEDAIQEEYNHYLESYEELFDETHRLNMMRRTRETMQDEGDEEKDN